MDTTVMIMIGVGSVIVIAVLGWMINSMTGKPDDSDVFLSSKESSKYISTGKSKKEETEEEEEPEGDPVEAAIKAAELKTESNVYTEAGRTSYVEKNKWTDNGRTIANIYKI